jgi:hypothetical protein
MGQLSCTASPSSPKMSSMLHAIRQARLQGRRDAQRAVEGTRAVGVTSPMGAGRPARVSSVSGLAAAVGLRAGVWRGMVTGCHNAAIGAFEPEHHDVTRVATRAS